MAMMGARGLDLLCKPLKTKSSAVGVGVLGRVGVVGALRSIVNQSGAVRLVQFTLERPREHQGRGSC